LEPLYVFKHVLTQEVAYEGLLLAQRQALHAAAGRALEARYAGRGEEILDMLAYHYARTDNAAKAVEYLTQVADRAARSHAHAEVLAALHEALAHAELLPVDIRDRHMLALVLRQAISLHNLGHTRESVDLLQREHPRLERLHDPTVAGPYYWQMGWAQSHLGEHPQAMQNLQQALATAAQCGDTVTMGKTHRALANEAKWAGQYPQAVAYCLQAIALLAQTPERYQLAHSFFHLGSSYAYLGELALAQQAFDEVCRIGEAIGDRRVQSYAAWCTGRILIYQREYEAAIERCHHALALATDPHNTGHALNTLGWAYL
jgi:tetratricopeptide (TPR) repeat protein